MKYSVQGTAEVFSCLDLSRGRFHKAEYQVFVQMWVKSVDLDKNRIVFVQMWGKKYSFGQKRLFD